MFLLPGKPTMDRAANLTFWLIERVQRMDAQDWLVFSLAAIVLGYYVTKSN